MVCMLCGMHISSGTRTKHFKRRHKDITYELKYFSLLSEVKKDTSPPPPPPSLPTDIQEGTVEVLAPVPQTEPVVKLTLPSMEPDLTVIGAAVTESTSVPDLTASMLSQHQQQFLVSTVDQMTQSLPSPSGANYLAKFPLEALHEHVVAGEPVKLAAATSQDHVTFDVVNMPSLEGENHYQVVQDVSGMRIIIQPTWQTVSASTTDTLPS